MSPRRQPYGGSKGPVGSFQLKYYLPGPNESVANEPFFLMQEAQNRHLNVKHGGPRDPWRRSGLSSKTLLGPRPHDTSHSKVRYTA